MTTIDINSQNFQDLDSQVKDLGNRLIQDITELQSISDYLQEIIQIQQSLNL